MKLIIEDDEGRKTVVPVVREEITIGRQDGNTIKLTERNVSRRHARFFRENGSLMLEDLGSYNGVRVNGDKIGGPTKVKEGDLIEIGDYDLGIQGKLEALANAPAAAPSAAKPRLSMEVPKVPKKDTPPPEKPVAAAAPAPTPEPAPAPAPAPAAASPSPAGQPMSAAGATAIIRLSDLAKSSGPAEIRDLEKSERPRLVGLNGAFRGKELYFIKSEVKLGRTDDNDLGLDHQSISRQHCKFALEDGVWKVYDNKSANGVRVNGEEYAVSAIKPGDTVELGHVKFRFCAPGERFTPPVEKSEAPVAAAAPSRPAPVHHAEPATAPIHTSRKSGSKGPLIGAVVAGVVVLAAVGYFAFGRGPSTPGTGETGGKMSAEDAVKQGDAAFAAHDFVKAAELYGIAKEKGTKPSNLQKAKDESPAQLAYKDMEKAMAAGDFDKAKAQLDALNADPDRQWAKQGIAKADAVKVGYVRDHLKKGEAMKASDPEGCSREATIALQADPSSEDAQKLSQGCKGGASKQVVEREKPPPPPKKEAPAGPSQGERNKSAQGLAAEGMAAYASADYDGAIAKCQQGLSQKPNGKDLGATYRCLGMANIKKLDAANSVKFMTAYLPYAPDAEKPKVQQIIAYFKAKL